MISTQEKETRTEKIRHLIDLLPKCGGLAYGRFVAALIETNQNFIAAELRLTDQISEGPETNEGNSSASNPHTVSRLIADIIIIIIIIILIWRHCHHACRTLKNVGSNTISEVRNTTA